MSCTEIAQHVRTNWTGDGVEVESTSDSKVRCRMPPMFQYLDVFVREFAELNCTIDLESRCDGASVSVVLIVYACGDHGQVPYKDHSPHKSTLQATNPCASIALLVSCFVVTVQVALLYLLRHKIFALVEDD